MTGGLSRVDPSTVLEAFAAASRRVARIISGLVDASPGERPGQYRFDLDADAACCEILHDAGLSVLSEESGLTGPGGRRVADGDPPDRLVIVDPVDGSTNAGRGLGHSATALALAERSAGGWVLEVAMVVDLDDGRTFTAVRGEGAQLDGRPISVSGCADLGAAIVGVSGLPDHHYGWDQFRALGSAALDISAVATGALDAWVDMTDDGHGVWDYAAALLIATEAGAVAADVEGRDLVMVDHVARRVPLVAASSALLAELLEHRRR